MQPQKHQASSPPFTVSDHKFTEVPIEDDVPPPEYNGLGLQEAAADTKKKEGKTDLLYNIDDTPPIPLSMLLGFQHYLTMLGATIGIPLIIAPALCFGENNVAKSEVLGTVFFVSGFVTLIQTSIGSRLPIVQGATYGFLTPVFAIMSLPQWKCPESSPEFNATMNMTTAMPEDPDEVWQSRMREIQGAIMVAALFEVAIGLSGAVGLILRFIGPLVIVPTISLIGLSLFKNASNFCEKQWWIAIMTMFFIALFSQYLRDVKIPIFTFHRGTGWKRRNLDLFKLFPILLAIGVSWLMCLILTEAGAFPENKGDWGYEARTDIKLHTFKDAKWFRFPYPGQWGTPTVSVAGVFGMLAGVLSGMIESIGDYYACAKLSGAPHPPVHAVNRGIMIEGMGCILSGAWGTGTGTTSYSENIGAIGITKVGSRRVLQFGAIVMMVFGMLGKFGALFVTIPDPIVGGVFMVMFGMVTAVGLSNLQYVDLSSTRNLFILGLSFMFGMSLPKWLEANPNAINTGVPELDQIFTVLCSTSMFVGGFLGFVLDNTIPGTREERGLTKWQHHEAEAEADVLTEDSDSQHEKVSLATYDIPLVTKYFNSMKWTSFVPICPSFVGFCTKVKQDGDQEVEEVTAEPAETYRRTDETAM